VEEASVPGFVPPLQGWWDQGVGLPRAAPLADSGLALGWRVPPRWGYGHRTRRASQRRESVLVSIERQRPGVAALSVRRQVTRTCKLSLS